MGKDLKGNQLGAGISQRKSGLYHARIRKVGISEVHIYDRSLESLKEKLKNAKAELPDELKVHIPEIKVIPEEKNGAYIYFITDGDYVKIGVAANVNKRLSGLQTGNVKELRVIKKIYSNEPYETEAKLHSEYSKHHIRGEWYDILNLIAQ